MDFPDAVAVMLGKAVADLLDDDFRLAAKDWQQVKDAARKLLPCDGELY